MGGGQIKHADAVRAGLACGLTYEEIGEDVGVSRQRVQQIARRLGLSPADRRKLHRRRLGERDDAILDMVRRGAPARDVAEVFDLHPGTVRRLCRRHGVRPTPPPREKHNAKRDAEVIALLREGASAHDVAERFGLRPVSVYAAARRAGSPAGKMPERRIDTARARALIADGLSLRQVAGRLGCSYNGLWQALRRG